MATNHGKVNVDTSFIRPPFVSGVGSDYSSTQNFTELMITIREDGSFSGPILLTFINKSDGSKICIPLREVSTEVGLISLERLITLAPSSDYEYAIGFARK